MSDKKVKITTNYGDIIIQLDSENTPNTTENFLAYMRSGHYDGSVFHRVIADFMIQGGGLDENLAVLSTRAAIKNEAKTAQPNNRGTIAMARTGEPHSATAQFFINVSDNDFLNFTAESPSGWGYCVFAKVVEGMDVVDSIQHVETGEKNYHQDVPKKTVRIERIEAV